MHHRRRSLRPFPLAVLGALLLLAPLARGADGAPVERWYEIARSGQKLGHARVVWAPSTWEGRKTVRDETQIVRRSVRDMMGHKDEFSSSTDLALERGANGTLWWQRSQTREADRTIVEETSWTGTGYRHVARVQEPGRPASEQVIEIPLESPVSIDAEAFLSGIAHDTPLREGQTFEMRSLNVQARSAEVSRLEVLGSESVSSEGGEVECSKVRETRVASGHEVLWWLDADGALVKVRDGQVTFQRTSREKAEETPSAPAEVSITTPSSPPLARVFSADRLEVNLHLQADPDRALPRFPASPWSTAGEPKGSDEEGWVIPLVLTAHRGTGAVATIPVPPVGFERDLEPTAMMQVADEKIVAAAREAVGDETDARRAAARIARWVFQHLSNKSSPTVAQASALQILEECQGDCSEHALLFVTLCRAAGIPARSCSGYVNIGLGWGAHAWAEIWCGEWIGADPTTAEVATGARYLFFGYDDRPDSHPGVVSASVTERMRFVATRVAEGAQSWDLAEGDYHVVEPEGGRYVHVLAGLEARGVPDAWTVRTSGDDRMDISGPGFRAALRAQADQGMDLAFIGLAGLVPTTFAGAPGRLAAVGVPADADGEVTTAGLGAAANMKRPTWWLHSRRRLINMVVFFSIDDPKERRAILDALEQVLAPTYAPSLVD